MRRTLSRHPRTLLTATLFAAGLALATTACSGSGGTADFTGTWGEEAEGQPSLTIADDSTFAGTDGCNRIVGAYTLQGDTIVFEQPVSTRMYCEGVDTWLEALATATISGGSLEVSDAAGDVIGSLARQ